MTSRNAYATLADYKAYVTARGQTTSTDAADDVVIDGLLDSASRFIDDETGRVFYPYVQIRYYDVPDSRELCLDEDLLEVLTLVNGDGTTITTSDYHLVPKNIYPAYAIKINELSPKESDEILNYLFELQLKDQYLYTYHWKKDSLLMWDNIGTMHNAVADYGPDEHRYIRRCQVMATHFYGVQGTRAPIFF